MLETVNYFCVRRPHFPNKIANHWRDDFLKLRGSEAARARVFRSDTRLQAATELIGDAGAGVLDALMGNAHVRDYRQMLEEWCNRLQATVGTEHGE